MTDIMQEIYEIIQKRKDSDDEKSYTAYLFREGLDKILKKIAEESGETIIAAKSLEAAQKDGAAGAGSCISDNTENEVTEKLRSDLNNEICDLLYHLLVLLAERDIPLCEVEAILKERSLKTGNLK